MSRQCPVCGKLLRSGSEAAISAHQRESQSCRPKAGRDESSTVKALEERLASVIAEGKTIGLSAGSFEQSQRNEAERAEIEWKIKQARKDQKADKRAIKELAARSMSAVSWTQGVLEGDARYAKASEDGVETRLAAETVGLVTADAFRQKREELEADNVAKRRREEDEERNAADAERKRKAARKAKREREERRGLSFDVEDE